jgi:hypothetical protein
MFHLILHFLMIHLPDVPRPDLHFLMMIHLPLDSRSFAPDVPLNHLRFLMIHFHHLDLRFRVCRYVHFAFCFLMIHFACSSGLLHFLMIHLPDVPPRPALPDPFTADTALMIHLPLDQMFPDPALLMIHLPDVPYTS